MTVINCNDKLNVTVNSNDGNICSNCSLEDNNELSDYGKSFDSRTYHQYLCRNDLQRVVTTPSVDNEGLFSGENMVNFVDNHSYEVCSEYVNNPVYDTHDWVSVNSASQFEIDRDQPSFVSHITMTQFYCMMKVFVCIVLNYWLCAGSVNNYIQIMCQHLAMNGKCVKLV